MSEIFAKLLRQEEVQQNQLGQEAQVQPAEKPLPSTLQPDDGSIVEQPVHSNADGNVPFVPEPAAALPNENFQSNLKPNASLQASNIASKQASLLAKISEIGHLKATNAATFRFPAELLDKLEEVEYRFRQEHKLKTTKNAIVVGSLAFLLVEYEEKKTQSILYRYLMGE